MFQHPEGSFLAGLVQSKRVPNLVAFLRQSGGRSDLASRKSFENKISEVGGKEKTASVRANDSSIFKLVRRSLAEKTPSLWAYNLRCQMERGSSDELRRVGAKSNLLNYQLNRYVFRSGIQRRSYRQLISSRGRPVGIDLWPRGTASTGRD